MKLFNHISKNISYEDIIQLDGAFSVVHLGYQKKLSFITSCNSVKATPFIIILIKFQLIINKMKGVAHNENYI